MQFQLYRAFCASTRFLSSQSALKCDIRIKNNEKSQQFTPPLVENDFYVRRKKVYVLNCFRHVLLFDKMLWTRFYFRDSWLVRTNRARHFPIKFGFWWNHFDFVCVTLYLILEKECGLFICQKPPDSSHLIRIYLISGVNCYLDFCTRKQWRNKSDISSLAYQQLNSKIVLLIKVIKSGIVSLFPNQALDSISQIPQWNIAFPKIR